MRGNWYNPHINKIDTILKIFFLFFFKLGQHGAYRAKLLSSEVTDSSDRIAVVLKAGLNTEINKSHIFGLCVIVLL